MQKTLANFNGYSFSACRSQKQMWFFRYSVHSMHLRAVLKEAITTPTYKSHIDFGHKVS